MAGRSLVIILILAGLLGIALNGAAIYSRLLYLGALLGIGGWIWTFLLGRSLKFHRSARVLRANVGDIFEERFEIENTGRIFAPWVEVTNESTLPFSSGSRLLTLVNGRQKRNYLGRTWLTRRGAFTLGPTKVNTGDPFSLFRWSRNVAASQTLIVYPMLFEIKSFIFPPGLLPGGRVIRRKSADITPHASGIREYMHGDAMKRIHWPTSLRRNQLMVKEFEQDPQAEVWMFLDSQRGVHVEKPQVQEEISVENMLFSRRPKFRLPPSTLEYSISITASLVHYFLAQKRAVGYVSVGRTYTIHPAERSERQEAKILETLAFVEANGELSIAALVGTQAAQLPQGSSAILVTPSVREDLIAAVEDLLRRYLRPVVILLDSSSFEGMYGTEKIARSLRERRVPVCMVCCDADLSQVLSEFSSDFISQDLRAWQKPELSQLI